MNEDVDRLLTEAGQRWQAAQPPPPEPDRTRWGAGRGHGWRPRASRYLTVGVVATAVAATIAGSMALWPEAADGPRPDPGATTAASSGPPDPATLVVRDGDVVEAAGEIEVDGGEPVRFCPPAPSVLPMPPPPCPFAVIAEGVDLDRLALRKVTEEGRLSGWARLRGVYRDGTLEVTHQWAEQPPDTRPGWESPTPPSCRPPAGGWRREHDDDTTALFQYVDGDRDRFSGLHVTYPGGDSREGVIVMVVGVIGEDPAAVQAELGQHYAGNLCVVPARHSGARLHQASDAVVALSRAQTGQDRVTIYSTSDGARGGPAYDRVAVEMVLLGPALYAELRKIGLDLLALNPWLRPAR